MSGYLTTFSGKCIDPLNIDPALIDIEDIAHSLSRIVRYNGHQEHSYTVGMHSICCAMLISDDALRLEALLHDAAEAYICDIPTPLKMMLPDYQQIEARMESALRKHFGLPATMSEAVRLVDQHMLVAESNLLHPKLWEELGYPASSKDAHTLITGCMHYGPRNTQSMFLGMAKEWGVQ